MKFELTTKEAALLFTSLKLAIEVLECDNETSDIAGMNRKLIAKMIDQQSPTASKFIRVVIDNAKPMIAKADDRMAITDEQIRSWINADK